MSAYRGNLTLLEGAQLRCGVSDAKPALAPSSPEGAEWLQGGRQALLDALVTDPAVEDEAMFQRLPALALALAQADRTAEATAVLLLAQTASGVWVDRYLDRSMSAVMNGNFEYSTTLMNRSSGLIHYEAAGASGAIWCLGERGEVLNYLKAALEAQGAGGAAGLPVLKTMGSPGEADPAFVSAVTAAALQNGEDNIFASFKVNGPLEFVADSQARSRLLSNGESYGFGRRTVYGFARTLPQGAPELLRLLKHESVSVREMAAFALGIQGATDAIDPLLELSERGGRDAISAANGLVRLYLALPEEAPPAP